MSQLGSRIASGLADARVSSNCALGNGTMSPAAISLSFCCSETTSKDREVCPPRITATRRTPATQSPQYRYPTHHFRGREPHTLEMCKDLTPRNGTGTTQRTFPLDSRFKGA